MKKKVLIIDDIEDVRVAMIRILGEDTYDYIEAASGIKGLEIIKSEEIDLVISDLAMPNVNGLELLQELGQLQNSPKFILVTGYANMFSDFGDGKKPDAIIEKPYRALDLKKVIGEVLGPH
jgi:DNA-binding NtrC family response regulator